MTLNSIAQEHKRRNEITRDMRDAMASHRERVMGLLTEASPCENASLCILGAGNANDIELPQLVREFREITLVDLDAAALHQATIGSKTPSVRIIPEVDVTGIFEMISGWQDVLGNDQSIEKAIAAAKTYPPPSIGTFDVVCSACMLSQLIDSVCMALPAEHPKFVELILAVRNRHLNLVAELLKPGGQGIVVTDFVSTLTAPELAQMSDEQLALAAKTWIKNRNFFTGINPFMIRAHYQQDATARSLVEFGQLVRPWKWDMVAKQFAVCAMTITRPVD